MFAGRRFAPPSAKESFGVTTGEHFCDALLRIELFRVEVFEEEVSELEFVVDGSVGLDPSFETSSLKTLGVLCKARLMSDGGKLFGGAKHQG